MQTNVAIINFLCFYGIGLPIGVLLGYITHLQVKVMNSTQILSYNLVILQRISEIENRFDREYGQE